MPMSGTCSCGHTYTAYQCPNCHRWYGDPKKAPPGPRPPGPRNRKKKKDAPWWMFAIVILGIFWLIYG